MIRRSKNNKKILIVLSFVVLVIVAAGIVMYISEKRNHAYQREGGDVEADTGRDLRANPVAVEGNIIKPPEIDYKKLDKDRALHNLMDQRKKELGIKNSLDMIIKSDESFKVGKIKVSMRDILEKTFLKNKKIFEEKIEGSGVIKPEKVREYGIYVVQPGDNIWNIHFRLIREYYKARGIYISRKADEPVGNGFSSGLGKVLKFSERMVVIYNLLEHKVDTDINLLRPLNKIVVYNMKEVFSFLKNIDYRNVDRLKFDGETLWISAQLPGKGE